MKLSEWVRKNDLDYTTAHRWFKLGTLPSNIRAEQLTWIKKRPKQNQEDRTNAEK